MAQDYPKAETAEAERLSDVTRAAYAAAEEVLAMADHIAATITNSPSIHAEKASASNANDVAPRPTPPMTLVDEHMSVVLSVEVRLKQAMDSLRRVEAEVNRLLPRK